MIANPRLLRLTLSLGLVLVCGAMAVGASPQPDANAGGLETNDYRIETDETHWNFTSGDFTMPHRVRFFRPGTDAIGDRANGNSKRGTATLIGNVTVHDNGNAPEATGGGAYNGSGAATLTCDQLEIDSKQKIYTATGAVHFSQGTRTGTAQRGVLDRASGTLLLSGAVKLTDAGSTMTANVVNYNLNTKNVDVTGAPLVIKQPVPAGGTSLATPKPGKKRPPR
ncbi:MAG: LptA/OstA family protein [Candidatus Elarobacter sp.]